MILPGSAPECFGDRGVLSKCHPSSPLTDDVEIAEVARALAHPARVSIIQQFAEGCPRMTKEIVAASDLASSTVSEHLRILREAGLVVSRHDGPCIWYCLCSNRLAAFAHSIDSLVSSRG